MPNTSNDDVIIVGSLSDKELRESIDKLVDYVGDKTTIMAGKFDVAMEKMKSAMKDFAITQKVSVDLMQDAWKQMSASFDAMLKAQQNATSSGNNSGAGGGNSQYADNTVGHLQEIIALEEKRRKEMTLGSDALRDQNKLIEEQKAKLKGETTSDQVKAAQAAKKELQEAFTMPARGLADAEKKLQQLQSLSAKFQGRGILDQTQWNRLNAQIQTTQEKIDKLRQKKPTSIQDVLGMDESSVDAIAKKMAALKKVTVDPQNTAQVKQLGNEYQRLKRLQAELMGQNIQMTHSNNYLAQSFGYIRNRIVYALTLGAVTNFTKQIYEVRGQYELLERSLGILIDNMRRGSEIFNELNAMALKSPFTLMELATGAKQLMAYNFAEDEVVETTRRLADISSALGVPMERLVYNLGQIRAQTVLTARDARDFANAGLAIVPMLADLYTKQKKFGDEIVTTSQVYDMMSNKMVSYADVMKVINSITDEGGKFFDFQAKQAETMKVQMNNLTLAWNNMLNEIGKNNQGLLTAPLKGLKLLFENWQMLEKAIRAAIVAMGMYYTRATLVSLINGTLITQGTIRAGYLLAKSWYAANDAWVALRTVMMTNPFGALAVAISTAIGYMALFNDSVNEMTEYNNRFGESGGSVVRDVEALYGSIESLDKESATYKKVVAELNQILGDFNLAQIDEKSNIDEILKSREKNIQLIKEEILERKHLNDLQQGRDTYDDEVKKARERLRSNLSNAITENFFGIGTINEEIAKNAPALTNIISDIIESNIELVANKTGDEYEKGVEKIFAKIQERLKNNKALGLSEETINSSWLENNFFRFYKSNIISNVINDLKEAKEANDQYNESVNENYEAEKRAAEQGATFNDRVEQTSDSLLKAANDTDKFYGKINQLIKDYSGQNIIDFLVRVNAEVPTWMAKMNGTELARLSARFAALASQAKKVGKEGLNINGTYFTTQQLYERAAQYASAVKQKQADTEARKSTTITKEASEALKDYKQSLKAVRVAKNRLKQGTADQTLVTEKEAEAQKKYNAALQKGVSLEDLKKAKDGKQTKTQKDPLGDALQKEIQLINDIQKTYKEYRKAGVDAETAKTAAANEYTKSLQTQNAQLKRFGIKGLTGEQLATMDLREIRDYYQSMLDIASKLKNIKGVEALEKALRGINVEITKLDYKKITDGLNSELGKLKDEYELAIELDANPELGDMFAEMFGINTSTLPKTFGDALDRAQIIINRKLAELNITTPFDLIESNINSFAKSTGLDKDGSVIKELVSAQKSYRDMFKKNITETEKMLDDYIKKYGDYSDKIAEIEASRLEKLKKLNEAYYTKEMRKRPEYAAKLNAIEQGASKEKQQVDFEEFKNSRYYTMMFENLDYISTKTIRDMRDRVRELIDTMNNLTPEQLKTLISQYEKLEQKLVKRSPFKTLTKDLKEYFSTSKERNAANQEFKNAQKEYDAQKKNVAALKEKYEQAKANSNTSKSYLDFLQIEISGENEILQILKQQLDAAQKKADKYNLTAKLAKSEALTIAQVVGQNLQSLGELRDFLQQDLGIELSDELNGLVDGLSTVGQGINKITSSATSGDVVGVITGVGQTIYGLYDGIASIFGGGSASNKKITKQIEDSERAVKRLEITYKNLEVAIENAYGANVIGAKQAAIANKELQLAELNRQLALEKSRDSKKRDDNRIIELQGQIIDLQNDIKRSAQEVATELLNISSVGDSALSFMDAYISALRKGEDAQAAFTGSWKEMIANLIRQIWVTKVIGPQLEALVDEMDERIKERSKTEADAYQQAVEEQTRRSTMSDDEIRGELAKNHQSVIDERYKEYVAAAREAEKHKNDMFFLFYEAKLNEAKNAYFSALSGIDTITQEEIDAYRSKSEKAVKDAKNALNKATMPTIDDMDLVAQSGKDLLPLLQSSDHDLNALLERYGLFEDQSDKTLSALQQGIQGITEDTAGALEAITSGMSQQVYYQSTLLEQIRDSVVAMDFDINLGVMSQILLQLQTSYQTQQAIQSILEGWSSPNGMSVRVEMI